MMTTIGKHKDLFVRGQYVYRKNARTSIVRILDYSSAQRKVKVNKSKKVPSKELSRWYSMMSRARKKGLDADLTIQDVSDIMHQPCIYCNSSSAFSELDRKDSNLGYLKLNVVPACRRCNTLKNNVVTYDEMMFIAGYLGWHI